MNVVAYTYLAMCVICSLLFNIFWIVRFHFLESLLCYAVSIVFCVKSVNIKVSQYRSQSVKLVSQTVSQYCVKP